MMAKAQSKRAYVAALLGATDTGKSTRALELLKSEKPSRLLVWDFKGEDNYKGAEHHFTSASDLLRYVKAKGKRARFYVAFRPSFDDKVRKKQFDAVCRIVYTYTNMLFLAEELRFVTRPGWSPVGWSMLTMTGRERNIKIIGTSQRPASIDKDFFSNATLIHSRRLSFQADRVAIADAMDISTNELAALNGHDYIEKDLRTGKIIRKKF